MASPPARPATRATNADKHPGRIVKRARRTKAEMEQERENLRQEKEAIVRKKDEEITRVARLEDQMAIEDVNAGSAHPRSHLGDLPPSFFGIRTDVANVIPKGASRQIGSDGDPEKELPPKRKRAAAAAGTVQPTSHIAQGTQRRASNQPVKTRKRKDSEPGSDSSAPLRHYSTQMGEFATTCIMIIM
jgi:hypothetical protein